MYRYLLLTLLYLGAVLPTLAQKNKLFPEIKGETLAGEQIILPENSKGKFTLIAVAYSKKAEKALKSWSQPVYDEFLNPNGFNAMVYDVNVYLVMLFTGAKKSVYSSVKAKMKAGTDQRLHQHTLLYKGAMEPYKNTLGLRDKDEPVLFVLDKTGKVIFMAYGAFRQRLLSEIGALVEN
jgi:hypothetical protein